MPDGRGRIVGRQADGPIDDRPCEFVLFPLKELIEFRLANAGREWGVPEQAAIDGEKLTIPR